jgi:uncharacterized membrane protein YeaQ/YmgE (transglycosylase-associated protein family)
MGSLFRLEAIQAPREQIVALRRLGNHRPACDARRAETGAEGRMEEFFQALGVIGFVFLVIIGALAGVLASQVEGGRNLPRNIVIGVVGALLLPFIMALVAAGLLAAGGLLLILFVAAVGAVVVLVIVQIIARR